MFYEIEVTKNSLDTILRKVSSYENYNSNKNEKSQFIQILAQLFVIFYLHAIAHTSLFLPFSLSFSLFFSVFLCVCPHFLTGNTVGNSPHTKVMK